MKRRAWLIVLFVVVPIAFALGAAGYFYWRATPSPASLSEAPAPKVKALSWETLKANVEQMDAHELREHGIRIFQQGDPDRAFLMFKVAAKKGDGWSALAVGEMYDPATFSAVDFDAKRTAFSKPNPRKALQWYDIALANGEERAQQPRERLIEHLKQAAANGDKTAERLLKKTKQ